jgi:predicted DNA-binding transcriptional regulator YafY
MVETSIRLLRLLSLLLGRRDWSGAEIAERLGVTTRTVRNDIGRLRLLGYQVHSTTGTAGGYRLVAGTALPPLLLDDDEAVAVAVSLSVAASGSVTGIEEMSARALAKVEQTLPSRLRHRVDALRSATVSAAGGGHAVDAAVLTTIAAAARAHEILRFDYLDHDGRSTVRRVEPHSLVFTGRRWYLLAWDTDRDGWRTFRADRVRPRVPTGPRFAPREPPDSGIARHVVRGTGSAAWRIPATVRLLAPHAEMADRLPASAGLVEPDGDGACLLRTGANSLEDLAGFLAGLDVPFTVLHPPELRAHLRTLAVRLAAAAHEAR